MKDEELSEGGESELYFYDYSQNSPSLPSHSPEPIILREILNTPKNSKNKTTSNRKSVETNLQNFMEEQSKSTGELTEQYDLFLKWMEFNKKIEKPKNISEDPNENLRINAQSQSDKVVSILCSSETKSTTVKNEPLKDSIITIPSIESEGTKHNTLQNEISEEETKLEALSQSSDDEFMETEDITEMGDVSKESTTTQEQAIETEKTLEILPESEIISRDSNIITEPDGSIITDNGSYVDSSEDILKIINHDVVADIAIPIEKDVLLPASPEIGDVTNQENKFDVLAASLILSDSNVEFKTSTSNLTNSSSSSVNNLSESRSSNTDLSTLKRLSHSKGKAPIPPTQVKLEPVKTTTLVKQEDAQKSVEKKNMTQKLKSSLSGIFKNESNSDIKNFDKKTTMKETEI